MAKLKIDKIRFLSVMLLLGVPAILLSNRSYGQETNSHESSEVPIQINLTSNARYQLIEHFGASDAWSTQFVGLWPDQKKNAIAELLFSMENDREGNPKGIGLSLWRFNIGAGSAEQGKESGIRDEWRRAESFLSEDGSYDWSKQAGQVWFANSAKAFGVSKLLVFPNSPPVSMTKTGKAYAKDGQPNLAEEQFGEFANYLVEVVKGLSKKGLSVDYISPVNEPQWDWSDGGQEGTPFWNDQIAAIVRELNSGLGENNLSAKIDIAEAGKINYLYSQADKSGRGDQINTFFNPESPNFIGGLYNVSQSISAHSYFTTSPYKSAISTRESLNSTLEKFAGLNYWMSEYCILGDNAGEINGNGRDLGIDPALYLARVIHNDLTVSNASAWHWWLAISPYNYKDGLIYIDKQKDDGNFYESKMLWALGNYSRFIRPGFQRISLEITNNQLQGSELLISAYQSQDKRETVLVIVNSSSKPVTVSLTEDELPKLLDSVYVTSETSNLEFIEKEGVNEESFQLIPARSIVTLIAN
ncbi:glycoside hydrolase [Algoriphagus winogradskyi]|uniref:O-Glycosyl hydrolase n=1 Tax=Algoriphagus winogradskyi TaxID=237017 RepID=A0ABY1PEE4_9BACT|nr:glycoside hydrolase [Algoriphagus winogradskyi]SMP31635.1 O-Glycosyl hydrolase [Algoriphagus winogradskyi]